MQSTPMRILTSRRVAAAIARGTLVLLVSGAVLTVASAQDTHSTGPLAPAAMIADRTITLAELDALARDRLMKLRNEEYTIRRQVLDDHLSRLLIEAEAKTRGMTVDELIRTEIESKVAPVTEEQKRAVLESRGQRPQGSEDADTLAQIESSLRQSRRAQARKRFVDGLRAKTMVRVLLEPPRATVDVTRGPSRGARTAPVTIVEYADFQCPYCRSVTQTLRALQDKYRGQVRIVFRHLPLPNHKEAPKAAEAAECAGEQGRFWEMHDKLFENQSGLQVADLKRRAAEMSLDTHRFDTCLDSGRFAAAWQQDREEGQRFGVSATPTFFINGRMVRGALPLQAFEDVIDEELRRRGPRATQ
jgi:protein-disulfide isomerase